MPSNVKLEDLKRRVTQPREPLRPPPAAGPPSVRPSVPADGPSVRPSDDVRRGPPLPVGVKVPGTASGELPEGFVAMERRQIEAAIRDEADQEMQAELEALAASGVDAPPDLGEATPIEELPPERRRELEASVAAAKQELPRPEPRQPTVVEADIPPANERPATHETLSETPTHCPQCEWNLQRTEVAEITDLDKQLFLQSWLGQQPFVRTFPLFGGQLEVTFRNLTSRELDLIGAQVHREVARGDFSDLTDQFEAANRYRMMLQLLSVRHRGVLVHDLPDGFDQKRNPMAQAHWEFPDGVDPERQGLEMIADYMLSKVLTSESTHRTMQMQCQRFNRLVARLEAVVTSPDFSFATSEPS